MKKKKLKNNSDENVRLVKFWMATFIPLILSTVLFVFCFIFERELWLYAICLVVFLIFVFLYIRAEKAIKLAEGYTLIQAMHFYLVCLKAEIGHSGGEQRHRLCEIAERYEYARGLKPQQLDYMYKTGSKLVRHFKLERLSKYV